MNDKLTVLFELRQARQSVVTSYNLDFWQCLYDRIRFTH